MAEDRQLDHYRAHIESSFRNNTPAICKRKLIPILFIEAYEARNDAQLAFLVRVFFNHIVSATAVLNCIWTLMSEPFRSTNNAGNLLLQWIQKWNHCNTNIVSDNICHIISSDSISRVLRPAMELQQRDEYIVLISYLLMCGYTRVPTLLSQEDIRSCTIGMYISSVLKRTVLEWTRDMFVQYEEVQRLQQYFPSLRNDLDHMFNSEGYESVSLDDEYKRIRNGIVYKMCVDLYTFITNTMEITHIPTTKKRDREETEHPLGEEPRGASRRRIRTSRTAQYRWDPTQGHRASSSAIDPDVEYTYESPHETDPSHSPVRYTYH
jgi:hypothetical protein